MAYKYNPNSRSRFNLKATVEVGQEYENEIEVINRRGDGVAKIEGFVIIFGKHSERRTSEVKFKTTKVGRRVDVNLIQLTPHAFTSSDIYCMKQQLLSPRRLARKVSGDH